MKSLRFVIILNTLFLSANLCAQDWNFIKEKNGIRIYTRTPEHSAFKSFKGETVYHSTMARLSQYIGNVKNFNWWDKNIRELKMLECEPGKHVKYYFVYKVPWPFNDRDLCVEVFINYDSLKGEKTVSAKPLTGVVPERKGIVRIKNYWQRWTLQTINENTVHAVLEGSVDPGGNVPAWLYNMVITETPLNVMGTIKSKVEKPDTP